MPPDPERLADTESWLRKAFTVPAARPIKPVYVRRFLSLVETIEYGV